MNTIARLAFALTLASTAFAQPRRVPSTEELPPPTTRRIRTTALPITAGTWASAGPGPMVNGQSEGISNNPVIGAIQAIVPHPQNADILWIGAVNGGVWKTTNATNASPSWTPMGDAFTSLSIGAMNLDPTDATFNTLVAGIGRFSSFGGIGGPRSGLLRTTNGGTNWTQLNPPTLPNVNVTGIAARGATIVLSANNSDSFFCGTLGIFRSTDTGASFSIVSGAAGSGLPRGRAMDLATDPTNNAVLYTAIRDASGCTSGGVNGIYKSTNTGATWTKVSDAAMDLLLDDDVISNVRISVGLSGQVFVGIVNTGQLAGLFRSSTGAAPWTKLDTPKTNEGGTDVGIHPRAKPGGQGATHFSIVADPTNANIVYVGGDRQPDPFPNSLNAQNYAGRLFRVNAASNAGSQATSLTNCPSATAACNGSISTTGNSSPHADSRRMVFDAAGNILESDDGGIYRRTNPRTTGDWFSVNGSLRVTEIHDIAWDRVSNMLVSGNQDTGTSEQTTVGASTWNDLTQGDGGDVAIDDITSATQSTRYTSFQNFGGLRRRIVNASGATTSTTFPALTVTGGGPALLGQFVTPLELNAVDPTRLLIAGFNDLYESLDKADTITALGFNRTATAIVYGGRSAGIDNLNLIYAISTSGLNAGPNVFVRTAGTGAPLQTATAPGLTVLRDIAVDPADWQKAYVINTAGEVWSTPNAGATWTNITGNLGSGMTDLRSITVIPGTPAVLAVGGVNGVFRMLTNAAGVWTQWGTGLTAAPVWDLEYDSGDDTLIAATMGRGAWTLTPVSGGPLPVLSINDVAVAEGNGGTTNANFTVTLSPSSASTVTVNYATADDTATSTTASFSNAFAIDIPDDATNATPYPSSISVAGVSGTVSNVTVKLNGFSHSYTRDVDVLLVGPGGQSVFLMSDVGGSSDSVDLTLTFDDSGASMPIFALSSGTYQPTNNNDSEGADAFGPPAPASGYGSLLSVYNGLSPNGTWQLFITDDFSGDGGSVSGGWTLSFVTSSGDYHAASGTLTFAPGVTSQPVTVQVIGDQTVESNETFFVNLSGPSNATIADAQGAGTITNDDGVVLAPPANVVATATSSTNVNITWTAVAGATSYRVYRSSGGSFSLVGSPVTNAYNDPTASANTAYRYKVRSFNGSESADSNLDLATTVIFTDPTLVVNSTAAKLVHFTELLTAVNAVRTLAGLSTIAFTAPTPSTSVTIRRQHLLDLRAGLDAARTALALSAISYTDPAITAGTTKIKAAHITELRDGVK